MFWFSQHGSACTVVGDHNNVYGHACSVFGEHNNVSGAVCRVKCRQNVVVGGESLSIRLPFGAPINAWFDTHESASTSSPSPPPLIDTSGHLLLRVEMWRREREQRLAALRNETHERREQESEQNMTLLSEMLARQQEHQQERAQHIENLTRSMRQDREERNPPTRRISLDSTVTRFSPMGQRPRPPILMQRTSRVQNLSTAVPVSIAVQPGNAIDGVVLVGDELVDKVDVKQDSDTAQCPLCVTNRVQLLFPCCKNCVCYTCTRSMYAHNNSACPYCRASVSFLVPIRL